MFTGGDYQDHSIKSDSADTGQVTAGNDFHEKGGNLMMKAPSLNGRPLIEAELEFRLRSGGAPAKDSAFMVCPKCEAPCFIRKSQRLTPTVKHLICHCTDSACGHTFRSEVVFIHSLVEGNIQRPDLNLPVCPRDQVPHVRPPVRSEADTDQISMFATG